VPWRFARYGFCKTSAALRTPPVAFDGHDEGPVVSTPPFMKTYHLTPTENGWVLAEEGQTPLDVCWTKWQALDRAREAFEREHVTLEIHRRDGTVEECRTYPWPLPPVIVSNDSD
jgi:hypothetical protein